MGSPDLSLPRSAVRDLGMLSGPGGSVLHVYVDGMAHTTHAVYHNPMPTSVMLYFRTHTVDGGASKASMLMNPTGAGRVSSNNISSRACSRRTSRTRS